MRVQYTDKEGVSRTIHADYVEIRPDGTVETYHWSESLGRITSGTQLGLLDRMGRIVVQREPRVK